MKELPLFSNNESISRRRQHRVARNNSSQNASSPTGRSVSRYKYHHQQEPYEQRHRKAITAIFSMIILVYVYTIFRTEELLEEYRLRRGGSDGAQDETNTDNMSDTTKENDDDETRRSNIHYDFDRFLIFKQMKMGQGTGNIMSGLLAAHLLGEEFNRIVCVEKDYVDFHAAFELKDPHTRALCETLVDNEPNVPMEDFLQAISFSHEPNECDLQERLSLDTKVIKFEGNTYPRWPKVPHGFFLKFYQPRRDLLDILPYTKQPESVVHLRAPDGDWDSGSRQGLDNESFVELGRMLPNDTYLVTNRVDWYNFFHEKFNWSHPNWSIVRHSISGITWKDNAQESDSSVEQQNQGPMQMWADWYTVLMAKHVYHTHSEFSNSAVHWMNIEDSNVLNGINKTTLELTFRPEAWIADGLTPAILDRTSNTTLPLEIQLKACDVHHTPITQNNNPVVANSDIPRPAAVTGVRVGGKAMKMDTHGEQINVFAVAVTSARVGGKEMQMDTDGEQVIVEEVQS